MKGERSAEALSKAVESTICDTTYITDPMPEELELRLVPRAPLCTERSYIVRTVINRSGRLYLNWTASR